MTVFNARSFLYGAIESILNQTYQNFELIIVDDGSNDSSKEIIKEIVKIDKRIKAIFLPKNYGPCYASNIGIRQARGIYLARMDADDISKKNRIEKQVEFLQRHSEVAMVGGQCKLIDKKNKLIGEKLFPIENDEIIKSLFSRNPIQHPACMINLKKVSKYAMLHDGKSVLAHDLELVFLASKYGKLANLNDFILEYRQYPESFSLSNPKKTFLATLIVRLQSILKYGYLPTLKGVITTLLQAIIVGLIPNSWIYPVYCYVRGMRKFEVKLPKFNFNFRFALTK